MEKILDFRKELLKIEPILRLAFILSVLDETCEELNLSNEEISNLRLEVNKILGTPIE